MNLNKEELEELNKLLSDKKLNIPSFRRIVSESGNNLVWLQKHILKKNKIINPRLKEILGLK